MKQIFHGIFEENMKLYTENMVQGNKVYGERIIAVKNKEYREWDPSRSKLGAAIVNGLKKLPLQESSIILYLGASTGTTVSHLSDIIGRDGVIYSVEFAERVFRLLLDLAAKRPNIIPLFTDARKPENYYWAEQADLIFVDLAQPDETAIAIRNTEEFLKEDGILMIAIKSRSIDVSKDPRKVYQEEAEKLRKANYEVLEIIDLEPYEKDHALIVAKKK